MRNMRKYLHNMAIWQIEVSLCLKTRLFFFPYVKFLTLGKIGSWHKEGSAL